MYTKKDLSANLAALNIEPRSTLMVHISYRAVGEVEGRGDTVLDALTEYMRPGLLVLPSHTWNNVGTQNPVMDVLYTPSCVGALPELFRKRPGALRSLHPTHSLAAAGRDAAEFLSGEEHVETPCGKDGVYYKLWERDARILLIGVNFTRNTIIHGFEEWDGAEGTIQPNKTDLYVINYQGNRLHTPQYRHCAPLGSETFGKLEVSALHRGILTIGRFGDADVRMVRAKPLRKMVAEIIKSDPKYLMRY
ncbi:MAG: AAC(3) family N-acetyltransferase [Oscillospiraceae bacterium]|nr:AAC(3) family N-acetyltransferase [Oscillospiraceae bacterium]